MTAGSPEGRVCEGALHLGQAGGGVHDNGDLAAV